MACFQGQTHGHEGFLLTPEQASKLIRRDPANRDVLFPFLTADDLLSTIPSGPTRYVIDFHPRDVLSAAKYKEPFEIVRTSVLPDREVAAEEESRRNKEILASNPNAKVNRHHANFLKQWWLLGWARAEMVQHISLLSRYISCGQVTKRPIFEFISSKIRPNAACIVFPFADDYTFGILQSDIHWIWFNARCSSLKRDPRYTSDTVFDSFAWPQDPKLDNVREVANTALALRVIRRETMEKNSWSLRELYRTLDMPGANKLRDAQNALNSAVRKTYGMTPKQDVLPFLLDLNLKLAEKEDRQEPVTPPGLPQAALATSTFVTADCVEAAI